MDETELEKLARLSGNHRARMHDQPSRSRRNPIALSSELRSSETCAHRSGAFRSFRADHFWQRREVVHIQNVSSLIPITKGIFAPTRRGGDLRRHPRNQPSRCPRWAWFIGEVSRGHTNLDRGDLRSCRTRQRGSARSYRWRTLRWPDLNGTPASPSRPCGQASARPHTITGTDHARRCARGRAIAA